MCFNLNYRFHTTDALMVAGEGEPENTYYDDQLMMNRYNNLSNLSSADQYHKLTTSSGNRGSSQTLVRYNKLNPLFV